MLILTLCHYHDHKNIILTLHLHVNAYPNTDIDADPNTQCYVDHYRAKFHNACPLCGTSRQPVHIADVFVRQWNWPYRRDSIGGRTEGKRDVEQAQSFGYASRLSAFTLSLFG